MFKLSLFIKNIFNSLNYLKHYIDNNNNILLL